jgi:hypothetical protein
MRQNWVGRRRTSPEGGNRGLRSGGLEQGMDYGDLKGGCTGYPGSHVDQP